MKTVFSFLLVLCSLLSNAQVFRPFHDTVRLNKTSVKDIFIDSIDKFKERYGLDAVGVGQAYVDSGLNSKQATLVSGVNLKSINDVSLIGAGDINLYNPILAEDYLVQGNGVTNDATTLQNAINAAASLNRPLFLKKGVYMLSYGMILPSNVTIFGEGDATEIKFMASTASARYMFEGLAQSNIKFYNLKINCNINENTGAEVWGIKINSSSDIDIENVTITGSRGLGAGLRLFECEDVNVFKCKFTDLGSPGVQLYGGRDITIAQSYFYNWGLISSTIPALSAPSVQTYNVKVLGCTFKNTIGTQFAIETAGAYMNNWVIANNHMDGNGLGGNGISGQFKNSLIAFNTFTNGAGGQRSGIEMSGTYIDVIGNTIDGGAMCFTGLVNTTSFPANGNHVTFINNTVKSTGTNGGALFIGGSAPIKYVKVIGNTLDSRLATGNASALFLGTYGAPNEIDHFIVNENFLFAPSGAHGIRLQATAGSSDIDIQNNKVFSGDYWLQYATDVFTGVRVFNNQAIGVTNPGILYTVAATNPIVEIGTGGGSAEIEFANAAELDTLYKQNNIAAWGNSLTEGDGATFPYTSYLSRLTGRYVYNGGISGQISTQIKDRMIADTVKHDWPTIIWAGRNNFSDSTTVVNDIATMVAALNHDKFLVLGILNGDYAGEYSGATNHTKIVNINNYLFTTYGSRYVPIREYLVSLYNPSISQDVTDHTNDIVPSSLRSDNIHLNQTGYDTVAKYLYTNYLQNITADTVEKSVRPNDAISFVNGNNPGAFKNFFAVRSSTSDLLTIDGEKKINTFHSDGLYSDTTTNKLTNGNFASGLTGWTATGWTDGTGKATHTTGNVTALSQNLTVVISRMYMVTYTLSDRTAGSVLVKLGTIEVSNRSITSSSNANSTNGSYRSAVYYGTTGGTVALTFTPTTDFNGSISNVSVVEIASNNKTPLSVAGVRHKVLGTNVSIGSNNGSYLLSYAAENLGYGLNAQRLLTLGTANTTFGYTSHFGLVDGSYNSAFGHNSQKDLTQGSYNTSFGSGSLERLSRGVQNIAFGSNALTYAAGGSSTNTAIGYNAGRGVLNMEIYNNTFIGGRAGEDIGNGGNNNTYIGIDAGKNGGTGDKNLAIGFSTSLPVTNGSNQVNISNLIWGISASGTGTTPAGQVSIGINTPATSALLDLTSTTKGFLPPRMTTAQRDAIASPAEGLMVYVTDSTKGWYGWNGSAWEKLNP